MKKYILSISVLFSNISLCSADAAVFNYCYRNCTKKAATQIVKILNISYDAHQHQKLVTLTQKCFNPEECNPKYTKNFRAIIGVNLEGSQSWGTVRKEVCTNAPYMPCTKQSYSLHSGECGIECTVDEARSLSKKLSEPYSPYNGRDIALLEKCLGGCQGNHLSAAFRAELGNSLPGQVERPSLIYHICSTESSLAEAIHNAYKDYPSKKSFIEACKSVSGQAYKAPNINLQVEKTRHIWKPI